MFKKIINSKKKEIYLFALLFLISVFFRVPVVFIFGDTGLQHEWILLVNNLVDYGILSFSYHDHELAKYLFPNLYMPPLYAYYLYFLSIFDFNQQNYILLILFSHIFLSSISVIFFYKLNKNFFSGRVCFYSSILYSLFPLHLYACSQVSSISLQIFLTILYFYLFFEFIEKKNNKLLLYISFVGGLLILLRQEFIAVLALSFIYMFFFYKVPVKKIMLILLITLITISPYLIRNILIFNTFTITKTTGYNLWKGSHPEAKGIEGSEIKDKNLQAKIDNIPKDKFYGLNYDNLFLKEAITNISNNPIRYLNLFVKKAFSFLFIDINSTAQNYYNPFHYLPVLLIGITSVAGIAVSNKKSLRLNYLILIFLFYVFIFSTVSILPRYKLIILPLQIIFTNVLLVSLKKIVERRKV